MVIATKDSLLESSEDIQVIAKMDDSEVVQALAAACAIVAFADQKISAQEVEAFGKALASNSHLKTLNKVNARSLFDEFVQDFQMSPDAAELRALDTLELLKKDRMKATAAVRACFAIVVSDGMFADSEKEALKKICAVLDQDASTYGL